MKGLGGSTELWWGRCKRSASAGAEGICTSSFIISGNRIRAPASSVADPQASVVLPKALALVDLGKHTGLSASMLSQLENETLVPTLPTLAHIAIVFDVSFDYFFGDKKRRRPFSIVRMQERMKFPDRAGSVKPNFFFECLAFAAQDKGLQAYLAEFPKRAANEVEEHIHDGSGFLHLLEGAIAFGIRKRSTPSERETAYISTPLNLTPTAVRPRFQRAPWWSPRPLGCSRLVRNPVDNLHLMLRRLRRMRTVMFGVGVGKFRAKKEDLG